MFLSLKERDLAATTRQTDMSMGMYRAFALLINLHHSILSERAETILVDDIGEGLDFERSTQLIRLIIERCKKSNVQILLTTNDRFVMNAVDLDYWHLVVRSGHNVRILDRRNSRKIFDDFKELGLSNFDFFSSKLYDSEQSGVVQS